MNNHTPREFPVQPEVPKTEAPTRRLRSRPPPPPDPRDDSPDKSPDDAAP
ncbi:MAG: hypothetical protein ACRENE_24770 [Polyangiaceae bacterium]